LTKHGFLDKIKSAAATASSENANNTAERDSKSNIRNEKKVAKWDALSEDYLLGSKKVKRHHPISIWTCLLRPLTSFLSLALRIGMNNRQARKVAYLKRMKWNML
jgi:hypothetical protein